MPNQTASTIDTSTGTASQFTECPNCETVFRVAARQLELAAGRVRCGSCLHVFVAAQHWVDTEPSGGQTLNQSPVVAVTARPVDSNDQPARPGQTDCAMPVSALKNRATIEFSDAFMALDSLDSSTFPLVESSDDDADPEGEEDWALQMLEAEAASEASPGKRALQAIQENPGRSTLGHKPVGATQARDRGNDPYDPLELETTESWMQELLGPGQPEEPAFEAPIQAPAPPVSSGSESDKEYVPEIFRKNSALLESIEAEPVEMHWRRYINPWVRHGLTLVGITTAAFALLAQYVWFNAQDLGANPKYRPLIAHFCQLSGCPLPARIDISRIKNSNLVVLKHPRVEGALLLDTIITNHAGFEQPFPVIYVRFSNLQDQTVAARAFGPDEYLGADLAGETMMPVRQPIHLSLELRDPGEDASNYRVQLLSPDQEKPAL